MSAIQQIVDAYVRVENRQALQDLLAHRQQLAVNMKGRTGYDFSLPLGQIENEIAVVIEGLEKLGSA
ncbi:hypothetical protein V1281_001892 [Nitrobacteraceae bacterium AZCC 2161]